ncbi:MAG: mechanosensitive ion channel family protein [Planctomycetaceae bacterium]
MSGRHFIITASLLCFLWPRVGAPRAAFAQNATEAPPATNEAPAAVSPDPTTPEAPKEVKVTDVVQDDDIGARLLEILKSTNWFQNEDVDVRNGVVFLNGTTGDLKYKEWATSLASKTEDAVAVVNHMQVIDPPILDFSPAWTEASQLGRTSVRMLPLFLLAAVLLGLTWLLALAAQLIGDFTVLKRIETNLLREVARKAIIIPIFLLGLFFILRITGLTQLAMTVLGGTGLIGLVIGIAFRDIAENFLSSILLSVQNPFRYGDLIEVDGKTGYVQRVNTRGTLLMTPEGNHVQIPNATIYKGTIINYTSNPNRRFSFAIGIGYDVVPSHAQDVAMKVLREHPALLTDPEPQVLVDELKSSTVNLIIYAWLNSADHGLLQVRSSVIRLILQAFADANIRMPDDQREIVFPSGVPVHLIESVPSTSPDAPKTPLQSRAEADRLTTGSEGNLKSEATKVQEQALKARDPEQAETNLLDDKARVSSDKGRAELMDLAKKS